MREKQVVANSTKKLIAALESGQSDALRAHLATSAKFHNYSLGNVLLIACQRPTATRVAGFRAWKDMDRFVKAGEKGIMILAPCVAGKKETEETDGDKAARRPVYFRPVYVFDVAQTDGKELPTLNTVAGDAAAYLPALLAFADSKGIAVSYSDDLAGARGTSYRNEKKIELLRSLSATDTFAVLAHELGHQLLHRADVATEETTRDTRELEAEAVSFVIGEAVGLDGAAHSADYIQLYDGNTEALTASLARIHKAAAEILDAITDESEAA